MDVEKIVKSTDAVIQEKPNNDTFILDLKSAFDRVSREIVCFSADTQNYSDNNSIYKETLQ